MATTSASRTVSVTINRPVDEVYRFVSDPENLPAWARGLCKAITRSNGDWIVETPEGPMRLRFVGRNPFGVLEHDLRTLKQSLERGEDRATP